MLDLDLAAFEVPLDVPWDAPDAAALDAQTLATHLDTHLTSSSARAILEVAVRAIFGTGSAELSLLFVLFYLHAGGGLTNLARTTGGAQERRFVGGSQQLAEGMATELRGGSCWAPRLTRSPTGPTASPSGAAWSRRARTPPTPPRPHHPIRCGPAAPSSPWPGSAAGSPTRRPCPGRDQLCQRMPMGAVTKVHAVYDDAVLARRRAQRPVGRRRPSARPRSTTRPTTRRTGPWWVSSPATTAAGWRRPGPRPAQAAVLEELARAFGPRARPPVEFIEQHWPAEPFTRGGPVAVSAPGALTGSARRCASRWGRSTGPAPRRPTEWCGYLDGALSSGVRAAAEVLRWH